MDLLKIYTIYSFDKYWINIINQGKIIVEPEYINDFVFSEHHGLLHALRVWRKAQEIIEKIDELVRPDIIHIASALHDAGRVYSEEKQFDNHHIISAEICWEYIKNYIPDMMQNDQADLIDSVLNHDFWTAEISKGRMTMPRSLEGKIVRAADKMSQNPAQEIKRYWACGKELGQALFKPETDLDFRLQWTPNQHADPRTDQLCWFCMLFILRPEDFEHPVIRKIYTNWEKKKQEAVDEIIKIAEQECPRYLDVLKMTIFSFKKIKELKW